MKLPYSDMEAFTVGPANIGRYELANYFSLGHGPHKIAVAGEALKVAAQLFRKQLDMQAEQMRRGRVVEQTLPMDETAIERKRQNLENARQKAAAKRHKVGINMQTGLTVDSASAAWVRPGMLALTAPLVFDDTATASSPTGGDLPSSSAAAADESQTL